jgi:hypothetical protein
LEIEVEPLKESMTFAEVFKELLDYEKYTRKKFKREPEEPGERETHILTVAEWIGKR